MKILHTADWHLGVKLDNRSREAEHERALDWLADLILREGVELLIIAGDVFDVFTPPNYAQRLYYNFLKKLVNSCCEHIVVVAGNHDSPHLLEAPRELLRILNVHVVGTLPSDRREQIIEIRDSKTDALKAVVGAVPYLPETFLRKSSAAETTEERVAQFRDGIQSHYQEIATLMQAYQFDNVPLITTGHLFVAGGERDGRRNTIHLGCLDVVDVSCFDAVFDYVALGHLHKPHSIGGQSHIRYSGSLIPIDFSETNIQHRVYIAEFEGKTRTNIHKIINPVARKLELWRGTLAEIEAKIQAFKPSPSEFKTWVRIELQTDHAYNPQLKEHLYNLLDSKDLEILGDPRQMHARVGGGWDDEEDTTIQSLADISVEDVFRMCVDSKGGAENEDDMRALEDSFRELQMWMTTQQRETKH